MTDDTRTSEPPLAFAERYAAVWNEPRPGARREAIEDLWDPDGVQYTPSAEHRGLDALEARVTAAHEEFVAAGGNVFVPAGDAVGHHGTVTFTTHMVPAAGGRPLWAGTIVADLGDDGRIRTDHQFPVPVADDGGDDDDQRTRATAEELLRRLGDPGGIAELFAATVDWELDWPAEGDPAVPWIRPRSTRADVADHFRALQDAHVAGEGSFRQPGSPAPLVLVDGRDAIVLGVIHRTARGTGATYAARCALRLTVEGGLITRYHVYEDSLTVARAFAAGGT